MVFDVFISYRRSDGTKTAKLLRDFLAGMGLRVFFDTEALVDGHRFTTQITAALLAAPHYILVGSEDAFRFREDEDWVRKEMTLALEHYKEDMGNRTITVVLPGRTAIPEKNALPEDLRKILDYQIIRGTSQKSLQRVLNAVTAVTHANLWHASYRWLENQKQPGGRFCNLEVNESLLPHATRELPAQVFGNCYGASDLLDAVREEESHMFLIGQGGIGKTTALLKIMNDAYENKQYDEGCIVPVFVELSAAPDVFERLYHGGSSSFIRRSVYRQIRNDRSAAQDSGAAVEALDSAFTQPFDAVVKPVEELLSRRSQFPQYLLLLDGLNEISTVLIEETGTTVAQMVVEEIRYLARNCPNVRILLTSRAEEHGLQDEEFTHLELAGIPEDAIYRYLEDKDCEKNLPPEMLEILRIPLFLIMYAELSTEDNICTQGEILHRFFSRRNAGEYTVISHLYDIDAAVKQSVRAVPRNRIDPKMHSFLLDFVLPEVGWYMEQQAMFHISGRRLRQIIWQVLANREEKDICGEFGVDVFRSYRTTATTANMLITRLGSDAQQVCEHIVSLCILNLGVLKYTERSYTFSHQHIRDYFAARKGMNTLMLANYMYDDGERELAHECMEDVFGERPLDLVVRRFMGEILQEHRNVPVESNGEYVLPAFTAERGLISHALDIYRDRFPGGKGIAALMGILKDVRKNLAGCNFSRLDLSACNLNGAVLSAANLQADFTNSLIHGESLLHVGHTSWINTVSYSDEGDYLITGGNDGKVLRCDAVTGLCSLLAKLAGPVWFAKILSDGCLLTASECRQRNNAIFSCENMVVQRTNLNSGEIETQLEFPMESLDVRLSADEKVLLVRQCGTMQVIDPKNLQVLHRYTFSDQNMITEFLGDSYEVLLSDGSTIHALTGEKGQFLPFREEPQYIWRAAVCDNMLCTMTEEGELLRLEVYRLKDGKLLNSFTQTWRKGGRRAYHVPNHNAAKYYNLVFSSQGQWLAMITPGDVYIYETKQWRLRQCLQNMMGQYINDVAFFDRDQRMAAGTLDGGLYLCETTGFAPLLCARGSLCRIRQMDICSDGDYLITYSADGMLRCWDLRTSALSAARFIGQGLGVYADFTEDGKFVQVKDGEFPYYTVPELLPCIRIKEQTGYHQISDQSSGSDRVHICKNGSYQYTVYGRQALICDPYLFVKGWANDSNYLVCYDLPSGQPLWGRSKMAHFSFESADGHYLLTSENDSFVAYDSATGARLSELKRDFGWRFAGVYGEHLFIFDGISQGNVTYVYQLPDMMPVGEFTGHIHLSDDRKWAQVVDITRYGQRQLDIYQLRDRSEVASFVLPADEVPYIDANKMTYVLMVKGHFAVCRSEESACVYRVAEGAPATCSLIGEFTISPGLDVIGLDLSDLHPGSRITAQQKKVLRAYGAIL